MELPARAIDAFCKEHDNAMASRKKKATATPRLR
jgi:hypothetical protein